MKKHLIAAAALATLSTASFAQTVYGVLDIGVFTSNNSGGKTVTKEATGQWFPTLFGITGSEDLGGGLKSSFNLQGSLGLTNGSSAEAGAVSTGLFGREATVSLSGSAGAIRLGRQIDNLFLQSFINGVISTHANSLAVNGLLLSGKENANVSVSGAFFNNGVEYTTPTISGLTAKTQYVIGGTAGASQLNTAQNLLVTYAGPVALSAGTERVKDSTASGLSETKTLLGAKYSVGAVDLATQYNGWKIGPTKTNGYEVGAAYHVSPKLLVGLNYESITKTGLQDMKITSLKAKYDLSKRTYVFGMAANYNKAAAGSISQGYAAATGDGVSSATNFNAGIVHSF